jgi:hypothetical protein
MTKRSILARVEMDAADVQPLRLEGLASLAGGWEGSDELVERIAEARRTPPRAVPDFD